MTLLRGTSVCLFLSLFMLLSGGAWAIVPLAVKTVSYHLKADNLAVVINDADPDSIEVGEYYRVARQVPLQNMVHIRIEGSPRKLTLAAFDQLRRDIDRQLTPNIEAMVLIWTTPYAVECNSITSALTLGFDAKQCEKNCGPGKLNKYFDSTSSNAEADFGMRLTMLLPISSVGQAKALIDRGVASKEVPATAYLMSTSDPARNVRAKFYPPSGYFPQKKLRISVVYANELGVADDVMFYSTGLITVQKLDKLYFLPGALADHLTSTGGDLLSTDQMSALRWLEAGATASYGTVSEPCNYPQKFPYPAVLLKHYLSGATAIEAYWKSVAWPAQGLFIGEPLAAPYR